MDGDSESETGVHVLRAEFSETPPFREDFLLLLPLMPLFRASAALAATTPRSIALMSLSFPPKVPKGVRLAATM